MNKDKADKLCEEGQSYVGRTLEIYKLTSGKEEKREFIFKKVFNFYFETVLRTSGQKHELENRYYDPKAILEEKNGREKLEASLPKVLDALKNDKTIYYNKF